MSEIENPPAFPQHPSAMVASERVWGDPGMSLRDWFAGQALAGLAAVDHGNDWGRAGKGHGPACARMAYAIADAMLAARKERADG
jgi:hypothetical protein